MSDRVRASPESLLAHVEWVRRLASTLVSGSLEADDVAQETWRVALARPPREPEQHGQLRHWLALVTRNVARRLGAAQRRHDASGKSVERRHDDDDSGDRFVPSDLAPSAAELVERAQLQRRVVDALLALDEPYRATLLYRFFEDLTPSVIAARTNVSVETVKTRLKRGLAQLREKLKSDFGDERGGWQMALAPLLVPRIGASSSAAATTTPSVATAKAATGVAASTKSIAVGGALMSVKAKLVAAAIALIVAGAVVWRVVESNVVDSGAPTAAPLDVARRESDAAHVAPTPEPAVVERAPDLAAERREEPKLTSTTATEPNSAASRPREDAAAVVGTVHDHDGALVADATVFLARRGSEGFRNREEFLLRQSHGERTTSGSSSADELQSTRSDSHGHFEFASAPNSATWTIAAVHPDRGVAFVGDAEIPFDERPRRFDLTLEPGIVVVGHVFTPDRLPVPGAHVELYVYSRGTKLQPDEENWGGRRVFEAAADASGTWRTAALPIDMFRAVVGPPKDFFPRCMTTNSTVVVVDALASQTNLDVTLEPLVTLSGRIVVHGRWSTLAAWRQERDASGELAKRLDLWACNHDPRQVHGLVPWPPNRGSTWIRYDAGSIDYDHDTYWIELATPQMHYLEVKCGETLLGSVEIPPQPPAPDVVVDLDQVPAPTTQAKRQGRLVVHVVGESGTPVVSGKYKLGISCFVASGSGSWSGSTEGTFGGDGKIDVAEADEGEATITASAPGFVSGRVVTVIRDGQTTEFTLKLARSARVARGHVDNADGSPDAGAELRVYRLDGGAYELVDTAVARTDSNGAFEIGSLPNASLLVVAASDSLAPALATFDVGDGGPLTLRRPTGVAVTLSVHCDDDIGIGAVKYRVFDAQGMPLVDDFGISGKHSTYRSARGSTIVLAPGEYTLEARAPGFETATTRFTASVDAKVSLAIARLPARESR